MLKLSDFRYSHTCIDMSFSESFFPSFIEEIMVLKFLENIIDLSRFGDFYDEIGFCRMLYNNRLSTFSDNCIQLWSFS